MKYRRHGGRRGGPLADLLGKTVHVPAAEFRERNCPSKFYLGKVIKRDNRARHMVVRLDDGQRYHWPIEQLEKWVQAASADPSDASEGSDSEHTAGSNTHSSMCNGDEITAAEILASMSRQHYQPCSPYVSRSEFAWQVRASSPQQADAMAADTCSDDSAAGQSGVDESSGVLMQALGELHQQQQQRKERQREQQEQQPQRRWPAWVLDLKASPLQGAMRSFNSLPTGQSDTFDSYADASSNTKQQQQQQRTAAAINSLLPEAIAAAVAHQLGVQATDNNRPCSSSRECNNRPVCPELGTHIKAGVGNSYNSHGSSGSSGYNKSQGLCAVSCSVPQQSSWPVDVPPGSKLLAALARNQANSFHKAAPVHLEPYQHADASRGATVLPLARAPLHAQPQFMSPLMKTLAAQSAWRAANPDIKAERSKGESRMGSAPWPHAAPYQPKSCAAHDAACESEQSGMSYHPWALIL